VAARVVGEEQPMVAQTLVHIELKIWDCHPSWFGLVWIGLDWIGLVSGKEENMKKKEY
jgi:hypothetical protein